MPRVRRGLLLAVCAMTLATATEALPTSGVVAPASLTAHERVSVARLRGGGLPFLPKPKKKKDNVAENLRQMSNALLGREAKNPIGCLPCIKRRKKVVVVTPAPPALDKKQPAGQVEKATENTVNKSGFKGVYLRVVEALTLLFPVWLTLLISCALVSPQSFQWLTSEGIILAETDRLQIEIDPFSLTMGIAMLSMGMTVQFSDFSTIVTSREKLVPLILAFFMQFIVTPLIAYAIGFFVPTPTALGMFLLASCPGSQLSNVASFVAGGSLPLSIIMSLTSTIASPMLTPLVFSKLAAGRPLAQSLVMDDLGMLLSMCKVVLLPILTGMYINHFLPGLTRLIKPITPLLSVLLTSCLCAAPVAGLRQEILNGGMDVAAPVVILHLFSFFLGYVIPSKLFGVDAEKSRTVAIEAGMQSSALGYLLALNFDDPKVATPPAIGVVVMSWLGALFSVVCRYSSRS